MNRYSVGLLAHDRDFSDRLSAFVRSGPYRERVHLKIFTDFALLQQFSELGEPLDLLLTEELEQEQMRLVQSGQGCRMIVTLLEEPPHKDDEAVNSVLKYQPLNKLLDLMLNRLEESGFRSILSSSRESRVIGIYSAVGGAGKTTFAVQAARMLARLNVRTAYLSLETIATEGIFETGPEDGFERLLYYALSSQESFRSKARQYMAQDRITKVSVVPSPRHPAEMEAMTGEDAVRFLSCLTDAGLSDVWVLDLDSALHDRIISSMACCDMLVWLIPDDATALSKTSSMLKLAADKLKISESELKGRSVFFLNRCGPQNAQDPFQYGIQVTDALPQQPEWLHDSSVKDTAFVHEYHQKLNRWIYKTFQREMDLTLAGGGRRQID